MWSSQVVFFSRASQLIIPLPASAEKDPPFLDENKFKLDSLTNLMLKMTDSLARLTQSHGTL